jgi:hypothetical protein
MNHQKSMTSSAEQPVQSSAIWLPFGKVSGHKIFAMAALILSGVVGFFSTPYMGVATFAYGLLNIGLIHIRKPQIHVPYMNAGILLDLSLVLLLEFQRDAINTALSFSLSPLQQAHIGASSMATILYVPILLLGWRLHFGKLGAEGRLWHRRLGIAGYIFRSLGFLLMFSLLFKNSN